MDNRRREEDQSDGVLAYRLGKVEEGLSSLRLEIMNCLGDIRSGVGSLQISASATATMEKDLYGNGKTGRLRELEVSIADLGKKTDIRVTRIEHKLIWVVALLLGMSTLAGWIIPAVARRFFGG